MFLTWLLVFQVFKVKLFSEEIRRLYGRGLSALKKHMIWIEERNGVDQWTSSQREGSLSPLGGGNHWDNRSLDRC